MRLNIDCVRDILVSVADNLNPDEYGDTSPIDPLIFAHENLSQYPQNEVLYWIRQLMDSRIIIPGKKYVSEPLPQIADLSISGYQFIDSVKKDSIWNKVKPKLLEISISSLSVLIQKGIEIGITSIG